MSRVHNCLDGGGGKGRKDTFFCLNLQKVEVTEKATATWIVKNILFSVKSENISPPADQPAEFKSQSATLDVQQQSPGGSRKVPVSRSWAVRIRFMCFTPFGILLPPSRFFWPRSRREIIRELDS